MNQNIKDPGLAAVFSFIFNGLGQLYNGQIFKGLCIIFFSAANLLVFIISVVLIGLWLTGRIIFPRQVIFGGALFSISLVFMCTLGIYSILDAYRVACRK
ncbi:MAG: hypothetical protein KKH29_00010 [Candidatus Omnitrophica bacterium]|nr:hypothetical protein [Candidatus Omnitrophota bacterium]MCG2706461.1 hypothetical protein [Candidatus Omnitrophota bacterium]